MKKIISVKRWSESEALTQYNTYFHQIKSEFHRSLSKRTITPEKMTKYENDIKFFLQYIQRTAIRIPASNWKLALGYRALYNEVLKEEKIINLLLFVNPAVCGASGKPMFSVKAFARKNGFSYFFKLNKNRDQYLFRNSVKIKINTWIIDALNIKSNTANESKRKLIAILDALSHHLNTDNLEQFTKQELSNYITTLNAKFQQQQQQQQQHLRREPDSRPKNNAETPPPEQKKLLNFDDFEKKLNNIYESPWPTTQSLNNNWLTDVLHIVGQAHRQHFSIKIMFIIAHLYKLKHQLAGNPKLASFEQTLKKITNIYESKKRPSRYSVPDTLDITSNGPTKTYTINQSKDHAFSQVKHVGQGSFGTIFKIVQIKTNTSANEAKTEIAESGGAMINGEGKKESRRFAVLKKVETVPYASKPEHLWTEFKTARALYHPHIARAFSHAVLPMTSDQWPRQTFKKGFLIQEYGGISLHRYLKYPENAPLDLPNPNTLTDQELKNLSWQLIDATLHCHQKNIIHSDIKPKNVVIGVTHQKPSLKLVDFGLSHRIKHSTHPGIPFKIFRDLQHKTTTKETISSGTLGYFNPTVFETGEIEGDEGKIHDSFAVATIITTLITFELADSSTPNTLRNEPDSLQLRVKKNNHITQQTRKIFSDKKELLIQHLPVLAPIVDRLLNTSSSLQDLTETNYHHLRFRSLFT